MAVSRQRSRLPAQYQAPDPARSVLKPIATLAFFFATCALAWWMASYSTALAVLLALGNAAFLLRLCMIQHDRGHGTFIIGNFPGRSITTARGDVSRRTHAIHRAATGNLDWLGGDLSPMTVAGYRATGRIRRGRHRIVRDGLFLFGVVPFQSFSLQTVFRSDSG